MRKEKLRKLAWSLAAVLTMAALLIVSHWLAPIVAGANSLNPYYFLSWGAPALFHEDVDSAGALIKLEPWRLLGLQLPVFAAIKPGEWEEPVVVQPPGDGDEKTRPTGDAVAIYHTHASEAFVPTSGQPRSEDFSQTVVTLGRVIKERLESRGIAVIHSEEYHDISYGQSYAKSRQTAEAMLSREPSLRLLLDLHRDGVGATSASGRAVTTCTIDGRRAGQIMFVVSTAHANWTENYRVANDLHNILENKYPGLSRGILSRENSTYNQDLHPGAVLVEIGGHWNTLDEAVYGAELFAAAVAEYMEGGY
ncbi:MAG: stage II sporulation protein P [Firmicutes bacterium]|nr:stage II sporulation protein P [Bacillota bacterium]HOB35105.1 stage II sporulation protein P [Bacillota bacterium]HPZ90607.1 stage II sporulation protein P [Bacillota bacterium]HQE02225.1 stage II sporulation protein P [Bacillota bacterium]